MAKKRSKRRSRTERRKAERTLIKSSKKKSRGRLDLDDFEECWQALIATRLGVEIPETDVASRGRPLGERLETFRRKGGGLSAVEVLESEIAEINKLLKTYVQGLEHTTQFERYCLAQFSRQFFVNDSVKAAICAAFETSGFKEILENSVPILEQSLGEEDRAILCNAKHPLVRVLKCLNLLNQACLSLVELDCIKQDFEVSEETRELLRQFTTATCLSEELRVTAGACLGKMGEPSYFRAIELPVGNDSDALIRKIQRFIGQLNLCYGKTETETHFFNYYLGEADPFLRLLPVSFMLDENYRDPSDWDVKFEAFLSVYDELSANEKFVYWRKCGSRSEFSAVFKAFAFQVVKQSTDEKLLAELVKITERG